MHPARYAFAAPSGTATAAKSFFDSGYFPIGLPLSRTFGELPQVPFRDHVWPLFLRENARRVLNLP